MYAVKLAQSSALSVTGMPTTLPKTVTLNAGWTFVPCPYQASTALAQGAPSFSYTQGDQFKSQSTFAEYCEACRGRTIAVALHVHYIYTTCTLHVVYMHTTSTLHVHYMYTTCIACRSRTTAAGIVHPLVVVFDPCPPESLQVAGSTKYLPNISNMSPKSSPPSPQPAKPPTFSHTYYTCPICRCWIWLVRDAFRHRSRSRIQDQGHWWLQWTGDLRIRQLSAGAFSGWLLSCNVAVAVPFAELTTPIGMK